jgi:hypothetical protein
LAGTVEVPYARRTTRTDLLVHQIALALGGQSGERLTARLSLRWSRDTLLRIIRRRLPVKKDAEALQVVGIDDWAWRRGQSYGTLMCDLERRRIVALLPDRDSGAVERWLAACPGIRIVARDRAGGYARAACPWRAGCRSGGRPMAPDGKRKCGLSRGRPPVAAADPRVARRQNGGSVASDRRRAPAIRSCSSVAMRSMPRSWAAILALARDGVPH